MPYTTLPEADQDRVDKLNKALVSNKELIEHRKKMVKLQEEMAGALQQEILKQYKWEGRVWHDSSSNRPYKATEIMALDGTTCIESPLGSHVIPRHHEQKDWQGYARSVCLCCGQKLSSSPSDKERSEIKRKMDAAKKGGFRSLAEYEAWVAEEDKRRSAGMEELRQHNLRVAEAGAQRLAQWQAEVV